MSNDRGDKSKIQTRIHQANLWDEYVRIREAMKKNGANPRDAWKAAFEIVRPRVEAHERGFSAASPVPIQPFAPAPARTAGRPLRRPRSAVLDDEFSLDGAGYTVASLDSNDPDSEDSAPVQPEVFPGVAAAASAYAGYVPTSDPPHEWARLIAGIDREKTSSIREDVMWVYHNAIVPVGELKSEQVPSPGAIALLQWVKCSQSNFAEFIRNTWSKLLPSKSQFEFGDKFSDDGRKQFSMLEDLERSMTAGTE